MDEKGKGFTNESAIDSDTFLVANPWWVVKKN